MVFSVSKVKTTTRDIAPLLVLAKNIIYSAVVRQMTNTEVAFRFSTLKSVENFKPFRHINYKNVEKIRLRLLYTVHT